MYLDLLKIFIPTVVAFFLGLLITPIATHFFYKYKMWKKYPRNESATSEEFKKIHKETEEKSELSTPRVGGIIIWSSVILTVGIFSIFFTNSSLEKFNFLSRNQTLIPFFTLIFGSLIGLVDDLIQIYTSGKIARDDKFWRFWKIFLIFIFSSLIGIWFFYKLDMVSIDIPFFGELYVGILIIPIFILVALATFSSGVIDGLDGLSGGIFTLSFISCSIIAYINNQLNLSAFSAVLAGSILAFLWFNIPPARFYMGETGIMGLTMTLATIVFLTNSVLILPIIGFPLVITSFSVILQLLSKKLRNGKKIFKIAPLHHHFEAIGWPSYKVTMRFWIIGIISSVIGVIIFAINK